MSCMNSGFLLVVEGVDGSGKTTLAAHLGRLLKEHGLPVVETREPGKTALGLTLRTLLQEGQIPMCQKAEYLLFAANRAQHMHDIIAPALLQKCLVLSDRLSDSSLVYQGHVRGLDKRVLQSINNWTLNEHEPDLVVYVRVSAEVAYNRTHKRGQALSSFEKEGLSFMRLVAQGYEELFASRSGVIIIDGNLEEHELAQQTYEQVIRYLQERGTIPS